MVERKMFSLNKIVFCKLVKELKIEKKVLNMK